jgi:predicted O-methyltransferase YrrM
MAQEQWTAVDQFINSLLIPNDAVLDAALRDAAAAGLPAIQVTPNQGKLLTILARAVGARRILEIGTLGAYSTIWLARALAPGGSMLTLEADARHAQVARANLARAGLAETVEVRVGPALESLPRLVADGLAPFDLVFIDADKQNMASYLKWALQLTHPGSLIIGDNVVRQGAVIDPASQDAAVQGVRSFLAALAAEPRVSATALQTVGSKGHDGFAIAVVLA